MNRSISVLALAAGILTGACGSGAAASPAAMSAPAGSAATASAAPSIAAGAPSAANAGNGTALCAFLSAEIPAMQQAGAPAGALSVVAIDYANWIAADASRVLPDAAAMDTLTEASCPDVRANVLKILATDSFANGF